VGYRFFKEYLNQNLPVFGEVLLQLVKPYYKPSVWVEGPTVVEAIYNQAGNELRVSLINGITTRPSGGDEYGDHGQRGHINITEVVPIQNVRIHVFGKALRRASDLAGKSLTVVREQDSSVITVPRLDQFDVITLDLS